MRLNNILIFILSIGLLVSCTGNNRGPEAKIRIKVIDDKYEIINDAFVKVGFLSDLDIDKELLISGKVNAEGVFSAKGKTNGLVGASISKNGYYNFTVDYPFTNKSSGRWEPWNPEVKVILRKIENPVSMYARQAKLELPVLNKEVGFDLLKYDWVAPHGNGTHSDIFFKGTRNWISELEFHGTLTIRFPNTNDGIQLVKENKLYGSEFKLPRYAPLDGYQHQIQKTIKAFPGHGFDYDYAEDNNYIFRVRSENKGGKLSRAMYGKLHGDIGFELKGTPTASINFIYYINPDYTRNLEFDPKRNLFTNLKSTEAVVLP